MAEIAARMDGRQENGAAETVRALRPANLERRPADHAPSGQPGGLQLTLEEIAHPAYMINYNLELTWFNEPARQNILGFESPPPGSESRNIFLMLFEAFSDGEVVQRDALLRLHLEFAKSRLSKDALLGLMKNLSHKQTMQLAEMYDDVAGVTGATVHEVPYSLRESDGEVSNWEAYGLYFREGVMIVHVPSGQAEAGLLEFLSRRDVVIRNLLRKRLPVLTPLAVLVSDLQNSVKICSELPPEEYFELINEIWSTMAPVFRKYYATHGKHVGDGMVYYFFPQPDSNYLFNATLCAQEIRAQMRTISKAWQLRKNWLNELYLNTGLHEGQEWLGTFQSSTSIEIAVLGDTINHAARLSDYARFGSVWATKNFVSKLSTEERSRLQFGITRRSDDGQEHFVVSSYSQLGTLVDLKSERYEKLRDIANLPITEIRSVRTD